MNKPDQFIRCRVADTMTGKFPKEPNATLLAGGEMCGRVLIDGEEKTETYNWGWIRFVPVKKGKRESR